MPSTSPSPFLPVCHYLPGQRKLFWNLPEPPSRIHPKIWLLAGQPRLGRSRVSLFALSALGILSGLTEQETAGQVTWSLPRSHFGPLDDS